MDNQDVHIHEKYRETVGPALKSKLEEFILYGYDQVKEDEIWEYLKKKTWKRVQDEKMLYQIVNDILAVKIGDYMNYATVEAFKSPSWFDEEGKEVLEKLL
ncbi:post-transcriptional regulator [Fredinandcohnia quinoae]|uniref:Post-transcriptional regulator n=1 Tax=Fredinandcohnia quinoae TaxID=2918902 RepID=A0AAW5E4Q2_9BACI|nr:post-transcriptional regulator [Fredinandcohnia sp. SECRCQ15]MCH1626534.1 post-transcriptional regulator [Fredinandcohnia sp. SECRCQ15]